MTHVRKSTSNLLLLRAASASEPKRGSLPPSPGSASSSGRRFPNGGLTLVALAGGRAVACRAADSDPNPAVLPIAVGCGRVPAAAQVVLSEQGDEAIVADVLSGAADVG